MSEQGLSLPQFSALVALAMEGAEITNTELINRWHLDIRKKDRDRLNELKLVESWKHGRSYVHVLTDRGWVRLEEILRTDQLPAMPRSPRIIASGLQHWLRMYMDRSGLRLAEVSLPQQDDLETRIRAAYAELSDQSGAWVRLARLRPLLGDVPRDEVDAALVRMERLDDVTLVPESNQKAFIPEDREAGVTIGDQEKHLLWIGEA